MKRIALTLFTASTLLFACTSSEKKEDGKEGDKMSSDTASTTEKKWIPVDSNMMNKAWAESMAITEHHKMMAKASGSWNGEVTMWMAAGAPPMTSTSTTENTMIFGGLYQQSKHSGNMMGAPFEGMSIMGYDNTLKQYVSTWIDNMGSGILVMTGSWDEATKTINMSGTMKNPANGLDCNMREEFKMIDDNNQLLTMYGPDPATGKEMKTMEIKYTRKK
jgi:hypothetical protein